MGETGCWENWVLLWWARPCSVNLWSNFLLMDGAVFPHHSLAWDQTIVGLWWPPTKGLMPACHNSQDCWVSVPDLAGGHSQPTPQPETPEDSQGSLAQSLVGSLLLSPVSWGTQGFLMPSKSLCFPSPSWPSKGQFSFQSQKKAMPKNVQITVQMHPFHMPSRYCLKSFKLDFSNMWTKNFQMYKLGLEKAEEPQIKLPKFVGS